MKMHTRNMKACETSVSAARTARMETSSFVDRSAGALTLQRYQRLAAQSLHATQLKRRAATMSAAVAQREIDTSSSRFLPAYGPHETPGWREDQGVPDWAKAEYINEAPVTLIASVADGKIGSVYYPGGRIRTTHSAGPEAEGIRRGERRLQFNVDYTHAVAVFDVEYPDIDAHLTDVRKLVHGTDAYYSAYWDFFNEWLAHALVATPVDALPEWVTVVASPDTATDMSALAPNPPDQDVALFEVFVAINGAVESWHPSRGVAAKFSTNKQVSSVLFAALRHLRAARITDAAARNVAFYNFIRSRLPDFVQYIRAPQEV